MVSQAELISKGYHSLFPGLISILDNSMGPFKYYYYTLFQNTEFLLDDKRVLILNETPLSIYWSTILRYC